MEIRPLYIKLNNLEGSATVRKELTDRARKFMRRQQTHCLDHRFKGRHTHRVTDYDEKFEASSKELQQRVAKRVDYLMRKVITDPKGSEACYSSLEARMNTQRCKLLVEMTNLCRAYITRNISKREDAFYHINTAWLQLHRLAYGEHVMYKNHCDVACTDHFIAPKDRRFGKRK